VGDQNQQKTTCLLAGLTGENSDSASYTETVRPVPLEIPSFLTLRCNACSSCVFDYLQGHSGEGFQAGRVSTQTGPTSGQQTCSSRGRNPKGSSAANVDKPASREFAREWQFNGLATTRPKRLPRSRHLARNVPYLSSHAGAVRNDCFNRCSVSSAMPA
jgi:hypothetical protein